MGFRRADPAAMERVYWAYVSDVARFLRTGFSFSSGGRRLRFDGYQDPCEFQDAVQEIFLLAFSQGARRGYDGLHPFKGYLQGIARNVVISRYRKDLARLKHYRILDDLSAAEPDDSLMPPPDEAFQASRLRVVLEDFVSGLTAEQREVVRLHFVERLGQRSTAEHMELDRNRIRKQIQAIRKKLWRRLKREGLDGALPFPLEPREVKR